MTGNPLPWILIALAVLATLIYKGQIRLPSSRQAPANAPASTVQALSSYVDVQAALAGYSAHDLSVAFAHAVRRDAEQEVAFLAGRSAADALRAKFTAPFSEPAPAGPAQAGPPPPPL